MVCAQNVSAEWMIITDFSLKEESEDNIYYWNILEKSTLNIRKWLEGRQLIDSDSLKDLFAKMTPIHTSSSLTQP